MHHASRPALLLFAVVFAVSAWTTAHTSAQTRTRSTARKAGPALPAAWMDQLPWRCIGPAAMGGRITAIAVNPKDSSNWWAATASGGLLMTTNNGTTFTHQFDRESCVSIGDVQVAPSDPRILWVGTGESKPRNSVSWGDGVYKSIDGGKTWKNMGLRRSFQIGRILIHPRDPNIVYVGALGRLWGANPERGLYKTTDGGKTWKLVLFLNDRTGVVDVCMHPEDPDTLLAAAYERRRDGFDSNDPAVKIAAGSGLHRSSDGGKTWSRVTAGLPTGKLGRIGIEWSRSRPDLVFLVLESERIGKQPENAAYAGITGQDADVGARLTRITPKGPAARAGLEVGDIVLAVNGKTVHSYAGFLTEIRKRLAGDKVRIEVSRKRKSVEVMLTFARRPKPQAPSTGSRPGRSTSSRQGRATSSRQARGPFATGLGGQRENVQEQQGPDGHEYGGVYRSGDGGQSFERINSVNPRPMYFSRIRVDPTDPERLYVLGIRLYRSKDGGKTFTADGGRGVHVDHHALWIDPADGRRMILGNDGGLYVTFDRMDHWDHLNHVAIGQFYHVAADGREAYRVYGGLQDNGTWGGPSRVPNARGPIDADWIRVGGGDGFVCRVDPEDPDQVYFESQNGNLARRHLQTGARGSMRPRPPRGKKRYRFNWNTPFVLSHHNPRIYYAAGNLVFRSLSRGDRLRAISPEISLTDRGSATALAESPREPDLLYVGSDDGALWTTRDGGVNWLRLYPSAAPAKPKKTAKPAKPEKPATTAKPKTAATVPGESLAGLLPGPRHVSAIVASRFSTDRVYLAVDGHRSDDDTPYVLVSEDRGASWRSLAGNLPKTAGPVRTVAEDRLNQDLLYLGTEFGAWVSIDRGAGWTRFRGNLPTVAVHAFAQPANADEIVAATHGRSLWILDVKALRQMTAQGVKDRCRLFAPADVVRRRREPSRGGTIRQFTGTNPPSGAAIVYSLAKPAQRLRLVVTRPDGELLRELEASTAAGLHRVGWDLRAAARQRTGAASGSPAGRRRSRSARTVPNGDYRVELTVDGTTYTQMLRVRADPDFPAAPGGEDERDQEDRVGEHSDG